MHLLFSRHLDVAAPRANGAVTRQQLSRLSLATNDSFIPSCVSQTRQKASLKEAVFRIPVLFGRARPTNTLTANDLWSGDIPEQAGRTNRRWISEELWRALVEYRQEHPNTKSVVLPTGVEMGEWFGVAASVVQDAIHPYFPAEGRFRTIDLSRLSGDLPGARSEVPPSVKWEHLINMPSAEELLQEPSDLQVRKTNRGIFRQVLQGLEKYLERHEEAPVILLPSFSKLASRLGVKPIDIVDVLKALEVHYEGSLLVEPERQLYLIDLRALKKS